MSSTELISGIMIGDEVFGADSEKVGKVAEVQPGYIVVEKGFFFPTDYYVPVSAINSAGDGQVYLNVSRDIALQSGWDTVPTSGYTTAEAVAVDRVALTADATDQYATDASYGGQMNTVVETADEIRIPVVEEELTATTRAAQAGAVRVEKDVVTEERVLTVPVTEERIRVERRIVDRPVDASDPDVLSETVVEIPLYTEEVDLQKRARVAEEIVISKEAVQRSEQVQGTVRREEVHVENEDITDPTSIDRTGDTNRAL
mgnify:CR=1 FL=1